MALSISTTAQGATCIANDTEPWSHNPTVERGGAGRHAGLTGARQTGQPPGLGRAGPGGRRATTTSTRKGRCAQMRLVGNVAASIHSRLATCRRFLSPVSRRSCSVQCLVTGQSRPIDQVAERCSEVAAIVFVDAGPTSISSSISAMNSIHVTQPQPLHLAHVLLARTRSIGNYMCHVGLHRIVGLPLYAVGKLAESVACCVISISVTSVFQK